MSASSVEGEPDRTRAEAPRAADPAAQRRGLPRRRAGGRQGTARERRRHHGPLETLDTVEAALQDAGWQPIKLDPYHQRYYRTWMHELPPLRHQERGTVVDLHHTILPPTSRLKPDPAQLWAAARRLGGGPVHVLAPADMVLHGAAHLFQDGDLRRALRDLVDIGDLLGHFSTEPGFWRHLVPRAASLASAGRCSMRSTRTAGCCAPIPDHVMAEAPAPPRPVLLTMDRLVPRVLLPEGCHGSEAGAGASLLLYMRSHWLRMPPWLLLPHLARQAIHRLAQVLEPTRPRALRTTCARRSSLTGVDRNVPALEAANGPADADQKIARLRFCIRVRDQRLGQTDRRAERALRLCSGRRARHRQNHRRACRRSQDRAPWQREGRRGARSRLVVMAPPTKSPPRTG